MDVSHILDGLNPAQREAVTAPPGPMLVLAGAGSGKTRVLVHRMAWLIQVEGVSPFSLLAVTFTNKAASEMRHRVEALQQMPVSGMWVGTFHGLAHRMLRTHWKEANLPQAFQVLDSDDQLRMVKRVLRTLELDETRWIPKMITGFINARKDEGLRAQHIDSGGDPVQQQLLRIYTAYEVACQRAGVVDFAELLLRTLELLRDNQELRAHYRSRFRHVLVDEFQDTNTIQYAWVRLLAKDKSGQNGNTGAHLFIVGDDDQAIYGWRGARVENIHSFKKDFPDCLMVRLEQNYRSTSTILNAANALISRNDDRLGKNLWTQGEQGEPIQLYAAFNEQDEARYVIDSIKRWLEQGNARSDVAILYRSNAQSRLFEEQLMMDGLPYRVYGGLRFFERAEIKDALAYLRLLANRADDGSFERVINQPTRGIGNKTVEQLRELAKDMNTSMWKAAEYLVQQPGLTARAGNALKGFLQLVESMQQTVEKLPLHEQTEHVIQHSGLLTHYSQEKGEKAEARVENLQELVNAARGFDFHNSDVIEMDMLTAFLAHAALEAGDAQAEAWEDCVQLMTLHSAKGLEFPLVFICGVEEGLFPSERARSEGGRLQEERRLCYVGITRARQHLVLTYAERRRLYGKDYYPMPSQFLGEIPSEYIQDVRFGSGKQVVRNTGSVQQSAGNGIMIGQRVMHQKFGEGMVTNCEGQGSHARVEVNFRNSGSKWLVLAYANLQLL
ncbi:MAG: DNA helicase II [Gammaproteobacteria bacterium]|jgi:DNA helicase II / ATP-dependent DNA helicase PcrA|nr:DNA helicase II [Gammaproteobacteria bacterium]